MRELKEITIDTRASNRVLDEKDLVGLVEALSKPSVPSVEEIAKIICDYIDTNECREHEICIDKAQAIHNFITKGV